MTRPKYTILDSFKFIAAVTDGNMPLVLDIFADNPDAWRWREDRDDDYSVLHHAIAAKRPEMVDLLIRKGASVEMGARNNMTPLMLAARSGNPESVALLLEAGADAQAKDAGGNTAISYTKNVEGAQGTMIRKYISDAMRDPAAGRALKSTIATTRAAAMTKALTGGTGSNLPAPKTARFKKTKPKP
ncbi:MAG: ankyrin repeat domain-containing protein [Alphaproteobacteria bacterium]|nr:ankyrin repeat domain-containing protein [Alphaproteobacteria bacterium]